jgi:acyl transferase domain-containing protein/NADPH:quinone reductase-like Zn-dependent oxidoreductase/acyl carrier protein/SAM-dependent methyltransferase
MRPTELLEYLRGLGLAVWADGDSIRYRGPKGAMTPPLLLQLQQHKAGILEILRAATAEAPASGAAAAPARQGTASKRDDLSAARIAGLIRGRLADVLFLKAEEIDIKRPLTELGLDSVLGIELVKSLNQQYGLALRATELYEYPTVSDLASYLAQLLETGQKGGGGMGDLYANALDETARELFSATAAQAPSTEYMPSVATAAASMPVSAAADASVATLTMRFAPQPSSLDSPTPRAPSASRDAPDAPAGARVVLKKLQSQAIALPESAPPTAIATGTPPVEANPDQLASESNVAPGRKPSASTANISAYLITRTMGIDELAISPHTLPPPQDDEIQLDVMASAINFGDLLCLNGLYPSMPAYPFVPGFEVSGIVRLVGRGVSTYKPGDAVIAVTGADLGGHASRVNVKHRLAVRKPEGISFAEAAALPVAFITAWHSLHGVARLRPGEVVLIQAAAGGVGSMAVQIAQHLQATVIGTTGSPEKQRSLREMGVAHVLDYRDPGFAGAVQALTQGVGVDVVFNTLASTMQTGLDLLAPGGRYVELAVAALKSSRSFNLARLCDNQSFHSVDLRRYLIGLASGRHRDLGYADYLPLLAQMAGSGQVRAVISHQFDFGGLPQALRTLESRANIGKVVVNHPPPSRRTPGDADGATTVARTDRAKDSMEPIAIVGLSGRFPGAADIDAFWKLLSEGGDAVGEIPEERRRLWQFDPDDRSKVNSTPCRWGGFLERTEYFDAAFFNISPLEAQAMDPQQRLLLQEAWRALEHAGYDPERLPTPNVGVFVGAAQNEYSHRFVASERGLDGYVLMGNSSAILSARISYFLNLQGPNLCLDTSCSSSLVALELACRSLAGRNCDMALAGGVSVLSGPSLHIMAGRAGMLSPTGRCRTFSQHADGFVPAEAVGVVALKRLADAVADGDIVHAVIRGIGVNQDGRSIGITAPNGRAQEKLINRVRREAGVKAETISYVETHGTGTKLGDPIEFDALVRAFRSETAVRGFCAIGSVKSNIGHALAAAGISGLIKVVLSLKHRQLVSTLHCDTVNEHIDLENSPFFVNRELRPWPAFNGEPRRAALSSFGFSGTNCHALIEEGPLPTAVGLPRTDSAYPFLLSAKTPDALRCRVQDLRDWLAAADFQHMADVAANLCDRRGHYRHRLAIVADSRAVLRSRLDGILNRENPAGVFSGKASPDALPMIGPTRAGGPVQQGPLPRLDDAKMETMDTDALNRLAQRYVQGFDPSWAALYPGERYRRLTLPPYPLSGERYWQQLPAPAIDKPDSTDKPVTADWAFVPVWVPVAAAPAGAAAGTLLIVSSADGDLTPALRRAHSGANIHEIRLGNRNHQQGEGAWELDDADSTAWETCLRGISPSADGVRIYFLCDREAVGTASARHLFRLVKGLLSSGFAERALDCIVVSRGACNMYDDNPPSAPAAAALGFALSVQKEMRAWAIRCVDAHGLERPEALSAFACALRGQASSLNPRSVAMWRAGRFYEQKLRRLDLTAVTPGGLRHGGVYLIVGGMGGIGAALSAWLARNYAAKLMLVGRGALDERRHRVMQGLEQQGCTALYTQADLTDEASLRSAVETTVKAFGCLEGVFHSALVLRDASVARMSEDDFESSLAAKTRGCLNLASALRGIDLDFLMFFSSVQSFVANPGQSNYAAASRYEDACALALRSSHGLPACVVNWGYWGSVGIASSEFHRSHNFAQGALSIEPDEGFAMLERCLAVREAVPQIVAAKLRPEVAADIEEIDRDWLTRLQPDVTALPAKLPLDVPRTEAAGYDFAMVEGYRLIEDWGLRSVLVSLSSDCELLVQPLSFDTARLQLELGVMPAYARLLAVVLERLAACGHLERDGDGSYRIRPERTADTADTLAAERMEIASRWPSLHPFIELLAASTPAFAHILRGGVPSTSILFPGGSARLVEAVYRGNAIADCVNRRVTEAVGALCAGRTVDRPLLILEIGAGVGGTTLPVLSELRRLGVAFSYDFTDLSESFLGWARRELGSGYPELVARRFDIDRSPREQGLTPGQYDLVLAANVLHATPNIRRSIRHAKSLLRRGGYLLLNESVVDTVFATLTFGTLEGWWKFEDGEERLPGSPLLGRDLWLELLRTEGFRQPYCAESVQEAASMPMAVLLASSDGCIPEAMLGQAPLPMPPARPPGRPADTRRPDATTDILRERIVESIARILQSTPAAIDTALPYSEYGVDSINGLQIIDTLNADLGAELKPTDLFAYSTVDRLASYLAGQELQPAACPLPSSQDAALDGAATVAPRPALLTSPPRDPALKDAIAIVGMSGRFPSAANLDAFWRNLAEGRDCIGEVPASRWGLDSFYDPDPRAPRRSYSKWGGFLDNIDLFDSLFFNIAPREAEHMDPQQRLLLQEAWRAFEDAGYSPEALDGIRCGVFVGCGQGDYQMRFVESADLSESYAFLGNSNAILAGRISYFLNLKGPSLTVDTACSSSLTAAHLACESLRRGECDLALVGGARVLTSPQFHILGSKSGMLSPTGRCRPFDDDADGFVPGECVAALLLKRFDQALADGDQIYALIRGSRINQDGRTNGITAPSLLSQSELISEVHDLCGVNADTITQVEAHGTGTRLGDPVEVEALTLAFRRHTQRRHFCAIGSVKSNIGHALEAAGVVGLAKLTLSLHRRRLVPSLHFHRPNRHIDFDTGPFFVNTRLVDWDGNQPLRGAISSFGFSGTNCHMVLDEWRMPN